MTVNFTECTLYSVFVRHPFRSCLPFFPLLAILKAFNRVV